jgi:hypothetical protein
VGDEVVTRLKESTDELTTTRVIARTTNRMAPANHGQKDLFSFVQVGAAVVTPNHPVHVRLPGVETAVWRRPRDLGQPFVLPECTQVYNFVLESRSSLFVNGQEVSTLGMLGEDL